MRGRGGNGASRSWKISWLNVGICLLMTQHDFDIVGLARKVEELGFGSLWAPEHGVVPAEFSVGAAGASLRRAQRPMPTAGSTRLSTRWCSSPPQRRPPSPSASARASA